MRTKILGLIYILLTLCKFICAEEEKEEIDPSIRFPSVAPYVKDGYNVFTTLECIYWKAIQEGLTYAQTGVAVVPGTTVSSPGSIYRPYFPWKMGFKIGLGYYSPHNGWDLYANYTYLRSSAADCAKSTSGNMVVIGLPYSDLTRSQINQVTSANTHWDLHFNALDLELGYGFYVSHFLSFRIFSGLKFTWQDQDFATRYVANRVTIGNVTQNGIAHSHQEQDVWGVGIRFGGNGNWYLWRGWSIASRIAFSGLYLDYDNTRRDRFKQNGNPYITVNHLKENINSIKAVMEIFFGIQGEWWVKDDRYHLEFQSGFDEQLWINFGEFLYFFSQGNGNFSLCGLTIKMQFDF